MHAKANNFDAEELFLLSEEGTQKTCSSRKEEIGMQRAHFTRVPTGKNPLGAGLGMSLHTWIQMRV